MERIIFHIDVNNAFLSWSAVFLLNNGYKYDIRDSYAVIGGDPKARKGIVLAKSNLCKKAGIKTAMTLYEAKKLCNNLKVYPPNYIYYNEMSEKLFNLLSKYTNDIEIASIDECYLDYGKVKKLYGDEVSFAYKIKKEIHDTLGFTVNIGIANNKLCAKMASDFSKPNKVHTLYDYEVETKMYPLPIKELFGVGLKTSLRLEGLGIKTIKDLACADIDFLYKHFKNQAYFLINQAKGIDYSPVNNEANDPKGISNEITLSKDITRKEDLYPYLMELCEKTSLRLRSSGKYASVVCVIVKDSYFKRKSHQKKLDNVTDSTDIIYKNAVLILDEMEIESVRLIGIRLDKLKDNMILQGSLFEEEHIDSIDKTLDSLKRKYGSDIIMKASLKKNSHKDC